MKFKLFPVPHVVVLKNKLKNGFAGTAQGPLVSITKSHKDDYRLYLHELEHVKQWWFTFGIHSFLYKFNRKYRLWSEAKAYAKQVKPSLTDLDLMAYRLALPVYDLDITQDQAKSEILRRI